MRKDYFLIYLIVIGVISLIGLGIGLSNFNGHNYYQSQVYNNLPSLQSEYPIQHYRETIDEMILNENNSDEIALKQVINQSNIIPLIYNEDGSLNMFRMLLLFLPIYWFVLRKQFRR